MASIDVSKFSTLEYEKKTPDLPVGGKIKRKLFVRPVGAASRV
jgi:hypothetical protein